MLWTVATRWSSHDELARVQSTVKVYVFRKPGGGEAGRRNQDLLHILFHICNVHIAMLYSRS